MLRVSSSCFFFAVFVFSFFVSTKWKETERVSERERKISNVKTQIFYTANLWCFDLKRQITEIVFEESTFIGQFEGDANKPTFLSVACFLYWSNTVSTRKIPNGTSPLCFTFFWYKKLSALNWYFFLKHPIWWQLNYFAKIKHLSFWLKCFKFQVPFSIYFFFD